MRAAKIFGTLPVRVMKWRWIFIDAKGLCDQFGVGSFYNAAIVDKPAQCSHRIGTTAVAEQINFVIGSIVLHDIAIGVDNVFLDARAGDPSA